MGQFRLHSSSFGTDDFMLFMRFLLDRVVPSIPEKPLSRQFFTTNSVSCQEWLSRTYPFAMIVAYHNGYYAQVIRFGTSALADLEKKQLKLESGLAEGA
ncbi:hypothetical protein COOONC_13597 [Cooperia oncophora]